MTLIDARDRFNRRREEARKQSGQFGEQHHTEPEVSLMLADVDASFGDQELAEGQAILDAPTVDTYTGPERSIR